MYTAFLLELLFTGKMLSVKLIYCQYSEFQILQTLPVSPRPPLHLLEPPLLGLHRLQHPRPPRRLAPRHAQLGQGRDLLQPPHSLPADKKGRVRFCVSFSDLPANLGASIYDVRKIFGFLDPFPSVTYRNQLILFLSSAFWRPPPPSSADVIYGSPLS